MKVRTGFVSNSSSSSFVIRDANRLSSFQRYAIENHIKVGKSINESLTDEDEKFYADDDDRWNVYVDADGSIEGYTTMDNFSMRSFLREIGVPSDMIEWKD